MSERVVTWTRLDDAWTERQVFESLAFDVRWHYLCMIQFCSRNSRYDGHLRRVDALRCSDVADSAGAVDALVTSGLVELRHDGNTVRLVFIEEHVPPPSMRDETRKERQRTEKRRSRLHRSGDHSECLPERCPRAVGADVSTDTGADTAPDVSRGASPDAPRTVVDRPNRDALSSTNATTDGSVGTDVSTDPGTGRDRTGQDEELQGKHADEHAELTAAAASPGDRRGDPERNGTAQNGSGRKSDDKRVVDEFWAQHIAPGYDQ